jgi:hypothetical protein
MKTFLEKGLVYFAVTVFVAIAAIVIGLIGIGLILTAAGNLSFWPALGSVLLGKPLSPTEALLAGGALLVGIVVCLQLVPDRAERFLETFAAIWVMGVMGTMMLVFLGSLICALGLPVVFAADYFLNVKLPIWSSFPIGFATWLLWEKAIKPNLSSRLDQKT